MRTLFATLLLLTSTALSVCGQSGFGGQSDVTVTLSVDHPSARPGDTVNLIVTMDHPVRWQTFWINPGIGLRTDLGWNLPRGFETKPTLWPIPKVSNQEDQVSHIYNGKIHIVTPLTIPESATLESVTIHVGVDWLECYNHACIPRSLELSTDLLIADERTADPERQSIVEKVVSQQPRKLDSWEVKMTDTGVYFEWLLTPLSGGNPSPGDLYFFETAPSPSLLHKMPEVGRVGESWEIKMKKKDFKSQVSQGYLYASNGWNETGAPIQTLFWDPGAFPLPPAIVPSSIGSNKLDEFGIEWLTWSSQKVRDLRAEGRPVLVRYTADWDVSSAVNKYRIFTSSDSKKLKDKIEELDVAMVEANWTDGQQEIRDDLARFNRNNIPVTLFYPANSSEPPVVLPQIFTAKELLVVLDGGNLHLSALLSLRNWLGLVFILLLVAVAKIIGLKLSRGHK